MNKKLPTHVVMLFCLWALLLIVSLIITSSTKDLDKCRYYDKKVEAAELSKKCQEAIKEYKIEHGIVILKEDIYESGMLGVKASYITTTSGSLDAKKTSINPDFASVAIDMFKEAGLKVGDEVGCTFSGSFPALNISVMCAIEVFGLKSTIIASIGASTYGANNPEFNFVDMIHYLNEIGLLHVTVDYASLGGGNDTGDSFDDITGKLSEDEMAQIREDTINRINNSNTVYIEEPNFEKNVELKMSIFKKTVSDMKLFINVGGNVISIGIDSEGFISRNGLIEPTVKELSKKIISDKTGLIERYLQKGIYVSQFLNIKSLASNYGIPYNPTAFPTIGDSKVYFEEDYNLLFPIVALVASIGFIISIIYLRKKKIYEI